MRRATVVCKGTCTAEASCRVVTLTLWLTASGADCVASFCTMLQHGACSSLSFGVAAMDVSSIAIAIPLIPSQHDLLHSFSSLRWQMAWAYATGASISTQRTIETDWESFFIQLL